MTLNPTSRTAILVAGLVAAAGLGLAAVPVPAQAPPAQQQGGGRAGGGGRGGQQPARDPAQLAAITGTGVIQGVVTTAGTGAPVRRVRVTLSGAELRGGRSTMTNDEGQFSFVAVPAGRFTLTASKAGYVDIPFGAKRPGRPGTPIQLADGQKMENAHISLPKGGVITGMVVDDSGEPSPGTQVRVMRYVLRTGERTLQQAGQDQTDDRGIYRVYGLQPGDYLVSATPRNQSVGDIRNAIAAEVESLVQQLQAAGQTGRGGLGAVAGGGRGGGRGLAGIDPAQMIGGGRGQELLARVEVLQQQLSQTEQEQPVAYAPVYYPGTPSPAQSAPVTLAVSEERGGVNFQLMLVPTARVTGNVMSADGTLPQGTQISLIPLDQVDMPPIPGAGPSSTRAGQDGRFTFNGVAPGQYRVMARANVRGAEGAADVTAQAFGRGGGGGGRGGRGGPGQITQVLWGSADISVSGQNVEGVAVALQPGMTVTGRLVFESSTLLPPTDMTRVRVSMSPRGAQQGLDIGGLPPAQVDATGRFTIAGVPPGRYTFSANAPAGTPPGGATQLAGGRGGGGGQWILKSAVALGQDVLDFPLVIEPNQNVSATLTFVDRSQEISGTIQDTLGRPTADYTIVLFASDRSYWVPQARRIQSARPGTDGKFSFRGIPAGEYRLTAVTDVEPGEWYDPNFLQELANASIPVSVSEGERKVQDIKIAGG